MFTTRDRKTPTVDSLLADMAAGSRAVAIPASLVAELEHHLTEYAAPGPDGLLLCREDGSFMYRTTVRRRWVKARTEVGLPHLTIHDLRHTGHHVGSNHGGDAEGSHATAWARLSAGSASLPARVRRSGPRHCETLNGLIASHSPDSLAPVVTLPERAVGGS